MTAVLPDGVVPHLLSPDGNKHVEWLKAVFGAEVKELIHKDKAMAKVMHCMVAINGGYLYLCDGDCAPEQLPSSEENGDTGESEASGFLCHVELPDPHPIWEKAMGNGCTTVMDLKVQSWGGLFGSFQDPFGFSWSLTKSEGSKPVPGVTPYLLTPNGECEGHIEWLKKAFGGEVKDTYHTDDGKVMHCAVAVNGGVVYLADAKEQVAGKPHRLVCHMHLQDPKPTWERAHENGATTVMDLKLQFWGDVYGSFRDTFGFHWAVAEKKTAVQTKPRRTGVIPYLLSSNCQKHVEWIKTVFDGELKDMFFTDDTKSKVMHCTVLVNDGVLYLADGACDPKQEKETAGDPKGFICHVEVPDPHLIWKKAQGNGAATIMELKKQFWGDLYGSFRDPFGYVWAVSQAPTN